jgi:DNA primase
MSMNFPQHIIRDIKDRLDIVVVLGRYMELKRAGRTYKGLCPFHGENAPSFTVSQERGFYHCFGCQAHGDVIRFVQEIENLSFGDAVRQLAEEAGVELPELRSLTAEQKQKLSEKDRMFEVNGLAKEFFQKQLMLPEGETAREYLKKRGVSREMIDAFALGYSPNGWDGLTNDMTRQHQSAQLLEKVGLVAPGNRGGYYDRFRHRVMFPIIMQNNRVVGFGGRALVADEAAKYINSPESPVFSKSHCLYGYHLARTLISRKQRCIVVEGNLDVVMMHQFGFGETVATLGTAMTEHHIRMLKRMTENLIIIYDGDSAGQKAMFRSLELFLRASVNARAVVLPDNHDPDSFLNAHGAEPMEALIGEARYLFDIWLEAQYSARQAGPRGASQCLHGIIPMLALIEPVERSIYAQNIAQRLGVSINIVTQALRQHATNSNWERGPAESVLRETSQQMPDLVTRAEETLVYLLIVAPLKIQGRFIDAQIAERIQTPALKHVAMSALDELEDTGRIEASELIDRIDDNIWKNRIANLLLSNRDEEMTDSVVERSFQDCLDVLSAATIEERIRELDQKLKQPAQLSGEERVQIVHDKIRLHQQLQQMKLQSQPR